MSLTLVRQYSKICIGLSLAGALVWSYSAYDVFIGLCIAGIFLHLPEIMLIALGGLLFGGIKGFICGWIGVVVGSTGTFLCVRYILRDVFQKSLESHFHHLRAFDERLAENGFLTVLLMRLVLFVAPPLNWAIGLTRVRLCQYIAGSGLGVIPGITITCYFADSIAGLQSTETLFTVKMALPAGLIATLLIVSGISVWLLFGKKPIPTSQSTR
jgi:uncharacterized membrane protein YdjX (TVP38/TMEM64 family)